MNFPQSGNWTASQASDRLGDLVATKNIDLTLPGYLLLARKPMVLYSHDQDAGFDHPIVLLADNQYLYIITTAHFYVVDTTADNFSILAANATNQPTLGVYSDAIIFNQAVIASGSTTVSAIAFGQGQSWPNPQKITGLGSNPHPLCVIEHLNQFAVGDGNVVQTYNTSYSNQVTLTLPAEYIVTGMRWKGNYVYIATRHKYGGDAKLFIWNGTDTSAKQGGYTVKGSDWIYSMCEYLGTMAIVTSAGQILAFNGQSFQELGAFPVYYAPYSWVSDADNTSLVGKVANRGMEAIGNRLFINIDGSLKNGTGVGQGKYLSSMPSGVWCFDKNRGLYHLGAPNYLQFKQYTPTSVSSSYLSFASAHGLQTGDPVLCTIAAGLTGVTGSQVYYAIPDSTTSMRLALSPADALAGRAITISGTPSTDKFAFDRNESFGQQFINLPGALCHLSRAHLTNFYSDDLAFGASVFDETLTAKGVVCTFGMAPNRGYFVTPRLGAQGLKDTIDSIYAYFTALRLDTDQIVVKYRVAERFGLPSPLAFSGSATWTSATTFTASSTTKDVKSIQVGDEIEVVKGAAAGYLAHVTSIDTSSTTYTFTIDETMPVSSGSFDFVANNWTKLGSFSNTSDENPRNFGLKKVDQSSRWIQFKIELRGRNIVIDEVALTSALSQNI